MFWCLFILCIVESCIIIACLLVVIDRILMLLLVVVVMVFVVVCSYCSCCCCWLYSFCLCRRRLPGILALSELKIWLAFEICIQNCVNCRKMYMWNIRVWEYLMECLKVPAQGPKTYPDRRRLSCWLVTALLICCWLYISALLMYFPIGLLVLFNKKDTLNTKMRFENKMQNENGSWFCSVFLFFFFVFLVLRF